MSDNVPEDNCAAGAPLNMVVWRCPVCLEIPPGRIYQCPNGHSFCDGCLLDEKTCPSCDVKVFGSKHGFYGVRNLLAECLLSQMKFECRWKHEGCHTLESRSQISKHENACIYGGINLCTRFSGTKDCEFKTYLYKSLNIDGILSHYKTAHPNILQKSGVEFNSCCFIDMDQVLRQNLENKTKSYIVPTFVELFHTDETYLEPNKELFIVLRKVEVDSQRNVSLAWAFVWLTSETKENDFTVKMKLTINGEPKAGIAAQMGHDCVPDISWTLNQIKAPQFAEWKLSRNQKLDFPFSLPLSHINKHYADRNGIFTVSFSFSKVNVM